MGDYDNVPAEDIRVVGPTEPIDTTEPIVDPDRDNTAPDTEEQQDARTEPNAAQYNTGERFNESGKPVQEGTVFHDEDPTYVDHDERDGVWNEVEGEG